MVTTKAVRPVPGQKKKVTKCSQKQWCTAMAQRLNEANDQKAGIAPVVSTNLRPRANDWVTRTLGVGYRTRGGATPTLFNVCPWCAQQILWEKNKGAD